MKHVTREEMREIDRLAIERHGIPVETLMENAGRAVAEVVAERISPSCPVVAVCGKGNNGGDGFVAARLLAERGFEVEVLATEREYDPGTATGANWARALETEGVEFVGRLKQRPMAVIVDALFGTGLTRPVAGRERDLIRELNALDPRWFPIVAVDIPSGLDANTGRPLGLAVKASATVTMGLPKAGFKAPAAADYLGELIVADIGFPSALLK
jgi:NAD(P)H-hydrate epimerase